MIGNIGSVSRSIEKMAEEFHVLQDDVHNGILRQREVNEQSEGSKQISEAFGYMNDAAVKVKDASDDVDSARKEITGDVETLRASSESVRASLDNMEKSVKVIGEGDDSLMNIATSISESIYCINSQIDRFKV